MPVNPPGAPPGAAVGPLDVPPPDDVGATGLWRLAGLAVLGGVGAGLVGGAFRWVLLRADDVRWDLLAWARAEPAVRWIVPVVCGATAVALARLVIRWAPEASGSGVQRVEAAIRGEVPPARLRVLPAKFVGGALALGAGLALGREGPTVQMGASVGAEVGRRARLSAHDTRTLEVALAGAGLGVAFNAPMGGALFVFEEVAHAFRTRLLVATFAGTASALVVARVIVGGEPILPIPAVDAGPAWVLLAYAALGVMLGALGVAYNRFVIALLDLAGRIRRVPPEVVAAAVGAAVALLGLVAPEVIGGGEVLTEKVLWATLPLGTLLLVAVVRWVLGPVSYAVGTPGGLFAPLLMVGAAIGAALAAAVDAVVPAAGLSVTAFAVVGMSTFFAATVRAPFTGVVLIVEMTATTALVVPMLLAAVAAVLTAQSLKGEPVYDILRRRMERAA